MWKELTDLQMRSKFLVHLLKANTHKFASTLSEIAKEEDTPKDKLT